MTQAQPAPPAPRSARGEAGDEPAESSVEFALGYLRFWGALFWAVLMTITAFSLTLFGYLMPKPRARRWFGFCQRFWGVTILWAARCPVEVEFEEEPPGLAGSGPAASGPGTGFLYFSNHQGILDILALFVALHRTPFVFAAKRELYRWPFIGWHLKLAGFIEVDRQNRERAILSYQKAALQVQQEGTVVTLYPEGTRSVDGSVLPFKKGAFVLALATQVPIVPVAVDGAQLALRKHTHRLQGHPIRVRVGRAIPTRGLGPGDRDELLRKTRRAVLELHRKLGAIPSPEEPMIAPPGKPSGEREE